MAQSDRERWLTEALATRSIDRVRADMGAAGSRINDARANVRAARKISSESPTLAIAGCHDAARKAITVHMIANGYRPKKGDGAHRIVIEYAEVVLDGVLEPTDLVGLDDLKRDRVDAEYGDFAQRRFSEDHLQSAAELAERVVNAIARDLAGQ